MRIFPQRFGRGYHMTEHVIGQMSRADVVISRAGFGVDQLPNIWHLTALLCFGVKRHILYGRERGHKVCHTVSWALLNERRTKRVTKDIRQNLEIILFKVNKTSQ